MEAIVVEEGREGKTLMIRGLIPVEARERAADVSTLTGISLTIVYHRTRSIHRRLNGVGRALRLVIIHRRIPSTTVYRPCVHF